MIKKTVLFLLRGYRKAVSPTYAPCCRFEPTCSAYAYEAVEEWGVIAGLALSFWRILRCNPFCRGGYDPVPKKKTGRKD